jgi:hypothetical protein
MCSLRSPCSSSIRCARRPLCSIWGFEDEDDTSTLSSAYSADTTIQERPHACLHAWRARATHHLLLATAGAALQESEAAKAVEASNRTYEALLQAKVGNDSFVASSAQTVDNMMVLRKHKEVQTSNAECVTTGAQWELEKGIEAAEADAAPEPEIAAARFTFAPGAGATMAVRCPC